MTYLYPPVGFHFVVDFSGLGAKAGSIDGQFQSVSGLKVEFETETLKEDGENRFEHRLPVRRKYPDVVLKRGLLSREAGSLVTDWCIKAFDHFNIIPIDLNVILLNEQHEPLMKWDLQHAWPKSWEISDFNAEESKLVIETLTLCVNRTLFRNP
jgi:phage tail-like protein